MNFFDELVYFTEYTTICRYKYLPLHLFSSPTLVQPCVMYIVIIFRRQEFLVVEVYLFGFYGSFSYRGELNNNSIPTCPFNRCKDVM